MTRLHIVQQISIDEDEIDLSFIRASGPGGQNVNKVASAVQLRFNLLASPNLPEGLKARAAKLAGSRLTQEGEIVLTADNFRVQSRNRDDAIERLVDLLREASVVPKARRATRPTLGSKKRRLDSKTKRGAIKSLRTQKPGMD